MATLAEEAEYYNVTLIQVAVSGAADASIHLPAIPRVGDAVCIGTHYYQVEQVLWFEWEKITDTRERVELIVKEHPTLNQE